MKCDLIIDPSLQRPLVLDEDSKIGVAVAEAVKLAGEVQAAVLVGYGYLTQRSPYIEQIWEERGAQIIAALTVSEGLTIHISMSDWGDKRIRTDVTFHERCKSKRPWSFNFGFDIESGRFETGGSHCTAGTELEKVTTLARLIRHST